MTYILFLKRIIRYKKRAYDVLTISQTLPTVLKYFLIIFKILFDIISRFRQPKGIYTLLNVTRIDSG